MGRLGTLALKGLGLLVLAFVVLSVIATIVAVTMSIVATIVSIAISLVVLGLLVLGGVKLASMLGGDDYASDTIGHRQRTGKPRDPESKLRDRYVSGELSEAEFERELDRLMDSSERRDRGARSRRSSDLERDRR